MNQKIQNPFKSCNNSVQVMYNVNDDPRMVCNSLSTAKWTKLEDKMFEEALVMYPADVPDRWAKMASRVPGKTPEDVKAHYEALVNDVCDIDCGRVELPNYLDDKLVLPVAEEKKEQISCNGYVNQNLGWSQRKRKGTCWTIEEHKLFLMGVDRFGWGDWRSISRNSVVTRTPAQVASHAQKFQLRQNAVKKERKRSSIHDITTSIDFKTVTAPSNSRSQGC